jgi:hypothetical protein
MTYWKAPAREDRYIPASQASKGSEVGFLEGFNRAWEYGNLVESQFGVANDLITQEQEMFQRLREAGETPPPSAFMREKVSEWNLSSPADEAARAIQSKNRREYDGKFATRDEELRRLKTKYPDMGIKTYAEMYEDTLTRFRRMEADQQRSQSWGGAAGGFLGAVVSGVDPRVNPLGTLTLPVGGFGKTIGGRILTEGLAQGGVQALEEVTGIRGNKRLLGLEPTASESLLNIGLATVGGAGLQGVGEGVAAGYRAGAKRWFKSLPNDPAPPPPEPPKTPAAAPPEPGAPVLSAVPTTRPQAITVDAEVSRRIDLAVRETIGGGRATARVAREDYRHVAENLEAWTGTQARDIAPPTATRPFTRPDAPAAPRVATKSAGETVDEIARRVDPDTFRTYDRLAEEKSKFRAWLDEAAVPRNDTVRAVMADIDEKIAEQTRRLAGANTRKAKIYEDRIRQLTDERRKVEAEMLSTDTEQMAKYRQMAMRLDEQMRDLAPSVSRAYARARSKFEAYDEQRAAIERMMQTGERTIDTSWMKPSDPDLVDKVVADWNKPVTIEQRVPELAVTPRLADEPAVDTVKRVNDQYTKDMEKALDGFQSSIPRILNDEEAVLDIDGTGELKVKLSEEINWTYEDGTTKKLTVRQMLEELQDNETELQAMLTCSVVKTSATA